MIRTRIVRYSLIAIALVGNASSRAAVLTLNPQTVKAWEEYTERAKASMDQRLASGKPFLWADEDPERVQRLRAAEILVAPLEGHGSHKVQAGLIHHWIGAAFIPDTTIDDVLHVIRDYDHYKDLYRPSVVSSKAVERSEAHDRFSLRMVNRSILLKSAFETDYESYYYRLSQRRVYSVTRSTRIQEVEDFGSPAQRILAEGQGSGIMWRLFSITRYLERDGGVYVEVEAMGLTRDIPASLHWMVDPIVRRLSRSALTTSLDQTQKASRNAAQVAKREGKAGTALAARVASGSQR